MKKTVLAALALSFAGWALADVSLVGTWQAKTAENGALKGTLTFEKSGTVAMHPEGFPAAEGTWEVSDAKKRVLTLTLKEVGSSDMTYGVNKDELTLTYDNGNKQLFTRKAPLAKSK